MRGARDARRGHAPPRRPRGARASSRRRASGPTRRSRTTPPTSARSSARSSRAGRWRSRSPAGTTSPSPGRRASARRCWRGRPRACCLCSTSARRPRSAASTRSPACRDRARAAQPATAVPGAAPHDLDPGARRRWTAGPAGRGEPGASRRALPRRDAPVPRRRARRPARARSTRAPSRSRAWSGVLALPARFMLLAAFNPCPCGWFGVDGHACTLRGRRAAPLPGSPLRTDARPARHDRDPRADVARCGRDAARGADAVVAAGSRARRDARPSGRACRTPTCAATLDDARGLRAAAARHARAARPADGALDAPAASRGARGAHHRRPGGLGSSCAPITSTRRSSIGRRSCAA